MLGSGCIPSKVDLFEHHPITWPHEPREQGVGQVFLNIFHLLGERIKRRVGLMTQGFVVRGQPPPPQINPTDCFPTCAALTTSPQQRINYQNPGSPFKHLMLYLDAALRDSWQSRIGTNVGIWHQGIRDCSPKRQQGFHLPTDFSCCFTWNNSCCSLLMVPSNQEYGYGPIMWVELVRY